MSKKDKRLHLGVQEARESSFMENMGGKGVERKRPRRIRS